MSLEQDREAVLASARHIIDACKSASREPTADETKTLNEKMTEIKTLTERIDLSNQGKAALQAFGDISRGNVHEQSSAECKTWGEHHVKYTGEQMQQAKGVTGASFASPEIKANTDTQVTTGAIFTPYLTEIDTTVIRAVRPRLVVADLLGSGTLSGNAISYFIEGAFEGAFGMVAQGGLKPQLHFADPTIVTDSLRKIAGWITFTDEMLEDLPFFVSEINNRLPYELAKKEEVQLLSGDGTGQNLLGITARSGIQTEARGTALSGDTVADTIFRAITKVSTGSGLDADGIVINPLDYQALRLAKDGNNQYYGGGFFAGQYGGGTIQDFPPIWGLRTVVTPAISVGTVLVGAFSQMATVYRKGGVRIESTNSHASQFISNLVTTRVEERIGLAMRRPAGLVVVTVTVAP